jgi:orotidine-5'-phosphate decarboxylase
VTGTCFGARLQAAVDAYGALCVGLDPHPGLLAEWGLTDDPEGLERFAMTCVRALAGRVAVVKPQSAFFERHGARGVAVLERVLAALADTPTLSILDVKRGDIGSTMDGYADAYLGVGAPLAADAVTLSPYLGFGSLDAAIRTASDAGRGVFVLARTSNPEGAQVQLAEWAGRSTAQVVVDEAGLRNAGAAPLGDVGVVVGATQDHDLDLTELNGPVLAPGLGAQGAGPADVAARFGGVRGIVLPTASRSVLRAGPDGAALGSAAEALRDELIRDGRPEVG